MPHIVQMDALTDKETSLVPPVWEQKLTQKNIDFE